MRREYCILTSIFLALHCSIAYACSDSGCGASSGNIFFRSYDKCNSVPFLSPSNDSKLNLELLLIDAGILTGSLATSQVSSLRVPFDMEVWQVIEPMTVVD